MSITKRGSFMTLILMIAVSFFIGKGLEGLIWKYSSMDTTVSKNGNVEQIIARKEDSRWFLKHSKTFNKSSVLTLFPDNPILRVDPTRLKRIFFYNKYFQRESFFHLGLGSEQFQKCEFKNCITTDEEMYLGELDKFDAVFFHPASNFSKPLYRSPDQLYIMQRYETPIANTFPYEEFKDFFNWTLSNRFDADIFIPKGTIVPRGDRSEIFNKNPSWEEWTGQVSDSEILDIKKEYMSTTGKEKRFPKKLPRENAIGWIVSHCNTCSDREVYADELTKYYPVISRGFCSGVTCANYSYWSNTSIEAPKGKLVNKQGMGRNSRKKLNKTSMRFFHKERLSANDGCGDFKYRYKYYLAFENSVCLDYISEKVHKPFETKTIPIVLGGGQYERLFPPHSYIDAMDFDSPRELAEYLKYLDQNEDKYMEYFWWRKYYEYFSSTELYNLSACVLCRMLNQPEIRRQSYSDIASWYLHPCEKKGSFPWSKQGIEKFGCERKAHLKFRDMGLTI